MSYETYEVRIYDNGDKQWYLDGKRHRTDGPAIEWSDGTKHWYLDGKGLSEQEFLAKTQPAPCNNKFVEVDGVRYRLVREPQDHESSSS